MEQESQRALRWGTLEETELGEGAGKPSIGSISIIVGWCVKLSGHQWLDELVCLCRQIVESGGHV